MGFAVSVVSESQQDIGIGSAAFSASVLQQQSSY
jgi:hypothetical protein